MQTEYIASGDHAIVVARRKQLKVLLGSCVGVALFDRDADVGGMIHLLLPEPASLGSSWSPGSYATTGLPLFINGLLKAGAQMENLKAVVAGGALFGRISQQDINLNIGGRCVEKVHALLRDLRIPIIREESCGFAPAIMTLDTATWQCEITTQFETNPMAKVPPQPSRQELLSALRAITPIPQTALKIIHLISADDFLTDEVAATIETDQVLAAKVISLCNSALFMAKQPIDSVNEAVVLLGSSHLLSMVATAASEAILSGNQSGYAMLKGGLYKHALAVAHTSRLIAQEHTQENPGVAYTAGLLHDIGKVGLDHYFTTFRPLFYQDHDPVGSDLILLEHQLLGTDHQQVGLLLADEWGLPPSITQAITHHHAPEQAQSHRELCHLVHLADLLTSWYLAGQEFERINTDSLHARLHFLGITPEQLPALIERVPWKTIMYL